MARVRVIVLDRKTPGAWNYLLWADVPAAVQKFYADSTKTSKWIDALPADTAALQTGSVVEDQGVIWTPGLTQAQLKAELESRWTAFQNAITGYNPWNFYGVTWNGTVWST